MATPPDCTTDGLGLGRESAASHRASDLFTCEGRQDCDMARRPVLDAIALSGFLLVVMTAANGEDCDTNVPNGQL